MAKKTDKPKSKVDASTSSAQGSASGGKKVKESAKGGSDSGGKKVKESAKGGSDSGGKVKINKSVKKVQSKIEDSPKGQSFSHGKKTEEKKVIKPVKKAKSKKNSPQCNVYIDASFNNTIITITDPDGNALSSSSAGVVGFRGTKKSTAFAATKAAQDAVNKAQKYGIQEAKVYIKGPGSGRNAAVKGLDASGLRISSLADITTLPFNGCRPRKRPRN
jgi:small subunit ribosomal protein S11